ncbi:MAG: DUF5329 family protein [Planctomycetota bacterium]
MVHRLSTIVVLALAPTLAGDGARGDLSIRVDGVPAQLMIPSQGGPNRVLKVTVQGGEPKAAWLACGPSSVQVVPLVRVDAREYQVNLDSIEVASVLESQADCSEFRVFAEADDGTRSVSIPIRFQRGFTPKRLQMEPGVTLMRFRVYQRSFEKLPGSGGVIRITLSDITGGRVDVHVHAINGQELAPTRSIGDGDSLQLKLADETYVLRVDRLVNLLFDNDYVEFSLAPIGEWEKSEVERMLRKIEESGLTFVRNGEEVPAGIFAAHLRTKLQASRRPGMTSEQFIEHVASRSIASGEAYLVTLDGGQTKPVATWLRERVEASTKPALPDGTKPP